MSRVPTVSPAVLALVAVLAIFVALTGCTTTRSIETPLSDRIPASLLECRGRPVAGALDRQSDVARYIVDVDAAGEDCRRKLGAVQQIVSQNGEGEDR